MFDIRRREEAEGERRMMGYGREEEEFVEEGGAGCLIRDAPLGIDVDAAFMPGFAMFACACWPGRERLRPRNISAVFRTWEKSCDGNGELSVPELKAI